ncbi:hypothetical protein SAMN05192569_10687 [Parageobacillus thermantarcticus]|uniref:Uncharacterized protein n=1 Tax=Parageobacillus thermantarcticus TaxID=186116 RepID=A0A1I0TYM4_9BACL|nr:hypothetical protein [Parageobacillus thermantarcticus]SFA56016.1 hypothetical protein SAMN05192569_10687 [Parageobacillus thermantarcticus]
MQIDKLNEQKQTIDALRELIKDMYFSNRRMSVDGASYHPKHIREAIKKLTIVHLEHALEQFKQASRERRIKNPSAYMKRILFNSVKTLEFNTTAEVQFEIFGNGHTNDDEIDFFNVLNTY